MFADTTSTTNPLASQTPVEGQSNDDGSDLLILAVCMLIVMLILVIVLLVVIIVLLTWKRPRPRKTKVESKHTLIVFIYRVDMINRCL